MYVTEVGPLRVLVALIALTTLSALLLPDIETMPWRVIFGAALPGIAFFLIWAIPFDALLARLLIGEADAVRRRRLRAIVRFDAAVWLVLVLCWGPFFWRLAVER